MGFPPFQQGGSQEAAAHREQRSKPHCRQDLQRRRRPMLGPQQGDGRREQLGRRRYSAPQSGSCCRWRPVPGPGAAPFPAWLPDPRGTAASPSPSRSAVEVHGDGAHGRAVRGQVREKPPGNGQQSLTQCPGQAALAPPPPWHPTRGRSPPTSRSMSETASLPPVRRASERAERFPCSRAQPRDKGSHTGKQYGHHCVSPGGPLPLIDPPKKNDAYLYVFKNFNIPLINFQTLFIYFG